MKINWGVCHANFFQIRCTLRKLSHSQHYGWPDWLTQKMTSTICRYNESWNYSLYQFYIQAKNYIDWFFLATQTPLPIEILWECNLFDQKISNIFSAFLIRNFFVSSVLCAQRSMLKSTLDTEETAPGHNLHRK